MKLDKIIPAMLAVQMAVRGMEKNSKVGTGSHSYDGTKASDVYEAFNKALSDNGLIINCVGIEEEVKVNRWMQEEWNYKANKLIAKSKQSIFCSVRTEYMVYHTSGQMLPYTLKSLGHGVDTQDKSAGKATTYALKNALINTFLVAVGKLADTDTDPSEEMDIPPVVNSKQEPKDLPTIPAEKFADIANFITTGLGKSGGVIPEEKRWPAIEEKYNITDSSRKVIEGLVKANKDAGENKK